VVLRSLATRPLIDRVRDELLRSISAGMFPDGRLPGEGELASRLSVSRTTLRAALRSLEEDGLLTRQRGRPTRINTHVVKGLSLTRVAGFYDLIRESGYDPTITTTVVQTATSPEHVAERLGAAAGAPIISIHRLFMADTQPAIFVREMIAAEHVRGPVAAEAVPNSIFEFAERFCDWNVDHTIVEIMSGVADEGVATLLGLSDGEPFLRLIETHYSIDASPFIVSDIAVVDRLIRFIVVRRHF
jgi:GntR family transcriptional regulator